MTTISIAQRFGSFVSSRKSAIDLRSEIARRVTAGEPQITLDFAGVEALSDSFTDELIAVLVQRRGLPWVVEHVRIVNLTPDDRRDAERVIQRRAGPVSVSPAFLVGELLPRVPSSR